MGLGEFWSVKLFERDIVDFVKHEGRVFHGKKKWWEEVEGGSLK